VLALRTAGAVVDAVVCAIDREQGGSQNLLAEGINLRAAITGSEFRQVDPTTQLGEHFRAPAQARVAG
jgi:orotate phosphoribosyltransferase